MKQGRRAADVLEGTRHRDDHMAEAESTHRCIGKIAVRAGRRREPLDRLGEHLDEAP